MTEKRVKVKNVNTYGISGERTGRWVATAYDGTGTKAIVVLDDGRVITAELNNLTVVP